MENKAQSNPLNENVFEVLTIKDNTFYLNEEFLKELTLILSDSNMMFYVISCVGQTGVGKSKLLSLIIHLMNFEYNKSLSNKSIFLSSSKQLSVTKGINAYFLKIKGEQNEKDKVLLFLDVEGLNSLDRNEINIEQLILRKIFLFAIAMSSLVIFCIDFRLLEPDANILRVYQEIFNTFSKNGIVEYPTMVIVRNKANNLNIKKDKNSTEEEYLKHIKNSIELNESFLNYSSATFFPTISGDVNDFDKILLKDNCKKQLLSIINKIFSSPKTLCGESSNKNNFFKFLECLVKQINSFDEFKELFVKENFYFNMIDFVFKKEYKRVKNEVYVMVNSFIKVIEDFIKNQNDSKEISMDIRNILKLENLELNESLKKVHSEKYSFYTKKLDNFIRNKLDLFKDNIFIQYFENLIKNENSILKEKNLISDLDIKNYNANLKIERLKEKTEYLTHSELNSGKEDDIMFIYKKDIENYKSEIKILTDSIKKSELEINKRKILLERKQIIKQKNSKRKEKISELEKQFDELKKLQIQKETEILKLKKEKNNLKENNKKINEQNNQIKLEIERLRIEEKDILKQEKSTNQDNYDKQSLENRNLENEFKKNQISLKSITDKNIELEIEINYLSDNFQKLETENNNLKLSLTDLNGKLENLDETNLIFEKNIENISEFEERRINELEQLKLKYDEIQSNNSARSIQKLKVTNESLINKIEIKSKEIKSLKSSYFSLNSIEEETELDKINKDEIKLMNLKTKFQIDQINSKLSKEKERLNNLEKEKENVRKKLLELQNKYIELKKKSTEKLIENERKKEIYEFNMKSLNKTISDLEYSIESNQNELELLKRENNEKKIKQMKINKMKTEVDGRSETIKSLEMSSIDKKTESESYLKEMEEITKIFKILLAINKNFDRNYSSLNSLEKNLEISILDKNDHIRKLLGDLEKILSESLYKNRKYEFLFKEGEIFLNKKQQELKDHIEKNLEFQILYDNSIDNNSTRIDQNTKIEDIIYFNELVETDNIQNLENEELKFKNVDDEYAYDETIFQDGRKHLFADAICNYQNSELVHFYWSEDNNLNDAVRNYFFDLYGSECITIEFTYNNQTWKINYHIMDPSHELIQKLYHVSGYDPKVNFKLFLEDNSEILYQEKKYSGKFIGSFSFPGNNFKIILL